MNTASTWMPLFIGDYIRDTGHLTTTEHGGYLLLLMHAWTREGILPADDMRLRTIAKMDPKQWKVSGPVLLEFFRRDGDTYRHKRLDRELANANANTEQRRAAGKASAEARAKRHNGHGGGDGGSNGGSNGEPTSVPTAVGSIDLNGRSTSVETSVGTGTPTEGQREGPYRARPSPSPSTKEREESKSTPHTPHTPQTGGEREADVHFGLFWQDYPRKDAKEAAWKAWCKARIKANPLAILAGLRDYKFSKESRFIPHATTWLNSERWLHDGSVEVIDRWALLDGIAASHPANPDFDMEASRDEFGNFRTH
jgi:uncharacterized protein YdaU (DUF1376 family)